MNKYTYLLMLAVGSEKQTSQVFKWLKEADPQILYYWNGDLNTR